MGEDVEEAMVWRAEARLGREGGVQGVADQSNNEA
jgi:hypothetical protein